MPTERELQDELARLDASITVLARVDGLSERARHDLAAQRTRRVEIAATIAAIRTERPD